MVDFTECFWRPQMPNVNFVSMFLRKTMSSVWTTWVDLGEGPQISSKQGAATEDHVLKKKALIL